MEAEYPGSGFSDIMCVKNSECTYSLAKKKTKKSLIHNFKEEGKSVITVAHNTANSFLSVAFVEALNFMSIISQFISYIIPNNACPYLPQLKREVFI